MSDFRPTLVPDADDALPPHLVAALRRPIAADPAHAARIVAAARALPRPVRRRSRSPLAPRWATRRGVLAPGGALLAAALTLAVGLGRAVVPGAAGEADAAAVSATVLGAVLQDTLHLVHVMLAAPGAARVSVPAAYATGNGPVYLRRDARTGEWSGTVMVARDVVRLAVVVETADGERRTMY